MSSIGKCVCIMSSIGKKMEKKIKTDALTSSPIPAGVVTQNTSPSASVKSPDNALSSLVSSCCANFSVSSNAALPVSCLVLI